jgi:sarcosine oxidase subunit alpha
LGQVMDVPMTHRLPPQPGEVIDRSGTLAFKWCGRTYPAYEGDTIISALAACGERIFSRSMKYHRPRGILSATFFDPNCIVQCDDEPNVRGAHRRVSSGMAVTPRSAWPSLNFDVKAASGLLTRFLGPGFYYKTFMKPSGGWSFYRHIFKSFVAGGKTSNESARGYYDKRYAHPDVLVAGGGPAGMAAAIAAARAGAQVMLVEEEPELGGHLRWNGAATLDVLRELRAKVRAQPSIEVLTDSVVTGRYADNWIAVVQRNLTGITERLIKARAGVLVVAAGLIERPYIFEGNDLPGVMLASATRRLIRLYAVRPGTRAVVFSANPEGDAAASDLEHADIEIVARVDARRGERIIRAIGRHGLREVELDGGRRVRCDLLITACGWTAPTSLLNMAGDRPIYRSCAARFLPGDRLPDDVMVTGGLCGDGTIEELLQHGRAIGVAAAAGAAGRKPPLVASLGLNEHPALFRGLTHGFVDFSNDVTSKDLLSAACEGFESIELLKRYTTATMGPAQGKLETVNAVAMLGEATHRTIAEVGTTTWRPPYVPITLGALAGRRFEPIYRSPMDPWHASHGAKLMVAGLWMRPAHYGDPNAEVDNTRQNVGVIDVTPLGKFDIRGPDAINLLNQIYFKQWTAMPVGAVRYGVMCGDDGVVFDDGVIARIGPEHYLMTTTSSGSAAAGEWIESFVQGRPDWRVHVTPMVAGFASINVAGPRSRELLDRLVEGVDLSAAAFPHMRVRVGSVAGVADCYLMRLGFVGELSFEIHLPAGYGLYVWEKLIVAGANLGVRPFGIEAQRIMRLEKGHPIIGQDTDGLTPAPSLGLRLPKLDRRDFSGLPEIRWQAEQATYPRLVGLRPLDRAAQVPEGCQLLDAAGKIVGRVTSSCISPSLGRAIALALITPALAAPGITVRVRLPNGSDVAAEITNGRAQFDPEGTRLDA